MRKIFVHTLVLRLHFLALFIITCLVFYTFYYTLNIQAKQRDLYITFPYIRYKDCTYYMCVQAFRSKIVHVCKRVTGPYS